MSKKREKRVDLLKSLTTEQLYNELRRRKGVSTDYKLVWVHGEAFYKGMNEQVEKINKEIENEKAQKDLTDKLKDIKD